MNKAKIINTKNASYLYSQNKILVVNFVLDGIVERPLNFEYSIENKKENFEGEIITTKKIIPASKMIDNLLNIMEHTKKIYGVDIPGAIVYMSNKIPKIIGENKKDIKIIGNNEIFNIFKKTSNLDINIKEKIKELI